MKPSVAAVASALPETGPQRIVRVAILFDGLISSIRAKELLENLVAGFKEDVRCELDMWNSRVLQIEWARRLITNAVPLAEIVIFSQHGDSPLAPDLIEWIETLPRAHSTRVL